MGGPAWHMHGILVAGVLFFGSFNVLDMKWQFQNCLPATPAGPGGGCPDGGRLFNKPWAQNWTMFMGEFWVLAVYHVQRYLSASRRRLAGKKPRPDDGTSAFTFAVPALCDVMGSGLSAVGMTKVPASVYQMMRSATIVITAMLTVVFLKKKLLPYHWFGIAIVIVGLSCVGGAAILDADDGSGTVDGSASSTVGVGIVVILFGQVAGSFQGVFEEYLMQGCSVSAKKTLGMEGMWGFLFQGALLIVFTFTPGSDNGVTEDFTDTFAMYEGHGSGTLWVLTIGFIVSVGMCNMCCLAITKRISAVTRCLVDSCRTLVVWAVSLALFYGGYEAWGAPWTPNSWLQATGFIFLVVGTLIYNAVIKVPCMRYRQPSDEQPAAASWSPKMALAGHKGLDDWEISPAPSPVTSPNDNSLSARLMTPEEAGAAAIETDAHGVLVLDGLDGLSPCKGASL